MSPETFERERLALFARHGFPGESRWVRDRFGRASYMVARGADACPTLLLHGGLSQAGEWALAAGRIGGNVLVPDRPGCGLSYPIDYRGLDYRRAAAEWVQDLLDGLGAERANLVANSMGGFFAMAFATAYPQRVRRLVLVGAPAGLDRRIPLMLRLWGNPVIGPLIMALKLTHPATPEQLRERVFRPLLVAHPERVPRELLEVAIAGASLPGVDRASYSMLRSVLTLRGWRPELMLRANMVRCPVATLFLWGDADAFAAPSSGLALAEQMPAASVEVLSDTGHLPHLDRPDAVAAAVNRFLGAGTAGGAGGKQEARVSAR